MVISQFYSSSLACSQKFLMKKLRIPTCPVTNGKHNQQLETNTEPTSIGWSQTQLQMNAFVFLYLLNV